MPSVRCFAERIDAGLGLLLVRSGMCWCVKVTAVGSGSRDTARAAIPASWRRGRRLCFESGWRRPHRRWDRRVRISAARRSGPAGSGGSPTSTKSSRSCAPGSTSFCGPRMIEPDAEREEIVHVRASARRQRRCPVGRPHDPRRLGLDSRLHRPPPAWWRGDGRTIARPVHVSNASQFAGDCTRGIRGQGEVVRLFALPSTAFSRETARRAPCRTTDCRRFST